MGEPDARAYGRPVEEVSVGFQRTVEDFTCGHCGAGNAGDGYTNHCTRCLWSRHVDVDPGDRAATCGGLMEPVDALLERDQWLLVHRCTVCGVRRRCRASSDDDIDEALAVARRRAEKFMTGGP